MKYLLKLWPYPLLVGTLIWILTVNARTGRWGTGQEFSQFGSPAELVFASYLFAVIILHSLCVFGIWRRRDSLKNLTLINAVILGFTILEFKFGWIFGIAYSRPPLFSMGRVFVEDVMDISRAGEPSCAVSTDEILNHGFYLTPQVAVPLLGGGWFVVFRASIGTQEIYRGVSLDSEGRTLPEARPDALCGAVESSSQLRTWFDKILILDDNFKSAHIDCSLKVYDPFVHSTIRVSFDLVPYQGLDSSRLKLVEGDRTVLEWYGSGVGNSGRSEILTRFTVPIPNTSASQTLGRGAVSSPIALKLGHDAIRSALRSDEDFVVHVDSRTLIRLDQRGSESQSFSENIGMLFKSDRLTDISKIVPGVGNKFYLVGKNSAQETVLLRVTNQGLEDPVFRQLTIGANPALPTYFSNFWEGLMTATDLESGEVILTADAAPFILKLTPEGLVDLRHQNTLSSSLPPHASAVHFLSVSSAGHALFSQNSHHSIYERRSRRLFSILPDGSIDPHFMLEY